MSHARGIFVYFPDSDDWISEDTFSDLAEVLNEGIFDIISFNREFVKSEDDKLMSPELKKQELSGNVALLEMLNQGDVTGFANDKIYKKSLFLENKIEFPVGKYYEDLGTNYKLFLAANRVYVTNKKYYYYFVDNPDSITQSWSGKKLEDIFGFSKEIFYSQAVQSVFNSSELKILNCFYTDNLIYVLTILYKTNLSEECKQLTMDVNSELRKNGVSLLRFKKRINFKKYVLYKLGLLKLVFDLRLRMKRYR
ncbi:glycosyl transferase family 2 [Streptococcus parasuis]|nr:glycosyl transferase family 2 [Streptococcus parasuis]QXF06412.1 glycosyl transferase family 2 [Streptococcus parasuis]